MMNAELQTVESVFEGKLSVLPRAVIPRMEPFALTFCSELVPSRDELLKVQIARRFGGVWVREQVCDPELYRPAFENPEPEWERFGFRGQVAKLLWQRGLYKKAIRFLSCNRCARPGACKRYPLEHKYFVPNGCEVVFCRECAAEVRWELFQAYFQVILAVVLSHGLPCGWTLARVNFTLWSDGSQITPERVKRMNAAVRAVARKTVGSRRGFGMLFVDEVGYEKAGRRRHRKAGGLNLHAHGLYFGPYLEWEKTRDLWVRETTRRFPRPSRGFWVNEIKGWRKNPERAVRHALNHMLKYVSKPPAVSPERLAGLIAAFNTARRVHALGLFYGKKPEREKRDCPCPKCREMGIVSTVSFEGRELPSGGWIPRIVPIEDLLREGYVDLRSAGRSAVFSMGSAREDSWGQSP